MNTKFSEQRSFCPEVGFPFSPDFNKNFSQVPTLKIPFLLGSDPFPHSESQETLPMTELMGAHNAATPLN
jgi:hypothetical protein